MKRSAGFTLVETLVVVAVIALIAMAGGVMGVGTYRNMIAKKAAGDFLQSAKYGRILAVEKGCAVELRIDESEDRFWLMYNDYDEQSQQGREVIVSDLYCKPVDLDEPLGFEVVEIDGVSDEDFLGEQENKVIVFKPNGSCQSAVVQIGDGKNHYTVSLTAATGKAIVERCTADKITARTIDLDEEPL